MRSTWPARRSISIGAVGMLASAALLSCGANESRSIQINPPAAAAPSATTTASSKTASAGVRLGCGTYCRSAGILNGGAGDNQPAVTVVSNGSVTPDVDGYVPVTLTCNLTVQCRGSVVLDLIRPEFQARGEQGYIAGSSDLVVDAGATTTLGVPLDAVARSWLQSHRAAEFVAITDASLSFGCTSHGDPDKLGLGLRSCGVTAVDGFAIVGTGNLTASALG